MAFGMSGLQIVISCYISNLLLRQKHNYKCNLMFEALNTSMSGRISRNEFRDAYDTNNIADQMPLKSNQEPLTADELFDRIKNCFKIIRVPLNEVKDEDETDSK